MKITGPSLQGSAGILGQGTNPLSVYMTYQQRRAQNEYALAQEERKKRDKLFDYVGTYNPDAKWEQYQAEVNNMAQTEVRDWTVQQLNQGRSPDQIQAELGFRQGRIKSFSAETGVWKDIHTNAYEKISKDAKYTEEGKTRLNDIFFNEKGGKRSPDEVRRDIQGIDQNIIFNPKLFNDAVVTKRFMDNLEVQAQNVLGGQRRADGTYPSSQDIAGRLPYQRYESGPRVGEVIPDPITQKPLMKMTDDLYTLAMGDSDMRLLMQDRGGDTRKGQEAYLQKMLPMFDRTKIENKVTAATKPTEGELGRQQVITDTNERFKNNEAIVSGFRPDLLANTFDPYQSHLVEYVNKAGQAVTGYDEKTKTYTTADGQTTAQGPSKLRVSFTKGGLAEDLETMRLNEERREGRITKGEYDNRIKELATVHGKLNTREFDITTKEGKRGAHHVLNRLLDEFLPPKERQAESYTKEVSKHYDQATGGVY